MTFFKIRTRAPRLARGICALGLIVAATVQFGCKSSTSPTGLIDVIVSFGPGGSNTLIVGQTLQMNAVARFTGGRTEDVTNEVDWSSSNTSAGQVSATGLVTAVGAGNTDISARLRAEQSPPCSLHIVP